MAQNQHVVAEWLLKLFARAEPGGLTLSVFDKATGVIGRDVPSRFSAALDDHSGTIEADLGRIESAATQPVRRLVARVAGAGPGLWPLGGATDNLGGTGALVEVASPDPEMRMFRPDRWLAEPSADDRARIARYLTLMFTRSSKMERAIADVSVAVRAGFVAMVRSMVPELLAQTLDAQAPGSRASAGGAGCAGGATPTIRLPCVSAHGRPRASSWTSSSSAHRSGWAEDQAMSSIHRSD